MDNEGINGLLSSLELIDFPSAKIKIDQLFVEWLSSDGKAVIESVLENTVTDADVISDEEGSVVSKSGSGVVEFSSSSHGPPRSPTSRKSPKKRTQSEMQSATAEEAGVDAGAVKGGAVDTPPIPLHVDDPRTATGDNIHIPPSSSSSGFKGESESVGSESQKAGRRRANFDSIPQFYVPSGPKRSGHRIEEDQLSKRMPEIEAFFRDFPEGVPVEKFVHMTKRLCGIPSFFNLPLCQRINELFGDDNDRQILRGVAANSGARFTAGIKVRLSTFVKYWEAEIEPYDRLERFFRTVKQPTADCIHKDDFVPFIQELLHFHPGLDFLDNHEEFQRKYALTVITRIFYKVNLSRSGRLSLKEVRNSSLMNAFMHVDEETDINRVMDYFSYEHFYVLYCRFFELDADKDSKVTREDLLRYGEHSLSEAIVDRIFQVGQRPFSDGREGGFGASGMSFPDFIYFMLAEEDKSSEAALRYWFVCCDLDGDGTLVPQEMRHFYKVQLHRVTSLGQEPINFQDVLCQMIDMIHPVDTQAITLHDVTRPDKRHISGVLFDVLFNLHKFMRFEARDPFQEKQRRDDMFNSDWDRYAYLEYHRLASEEESYANGGGGGGYAGGDMDVDQALSVGSVSDSDSDSETLDWGLPDDQTDDIDMEEDKGKASNSATRGSGSGGGGGSGSGSGSGRAGGKKNSGRRQ